LKDLFNLSELVPVTIEDEMRRSYLDYSMSVIVSRAIPDVRDGLKPVHRRILYAMYESGIEWNKPFKKSARIVGEVMGKYHPHGDGAIYDALVRMAQDFSLRLPLIDGQGNFGSMDGDPAAAMRYTESRMSKASHEMLSDIDKATVDFQDNYDGSEQEPKVLPAKFPNLLVNGAGGIAVGMATNIPTHNLTEVIDACCKYIENNEVTIEELMEVIKGPDFPTGGIIMGTYGIRSAFNTGRGSIVMRGKVEIEKTKDNKQAIVIYEVPYQVNKAKLLERVAELVKDKKIEGISDIRDESDKAGIRMVIELKKDAFADVILNQLYSYTTLQTSFGVNMLALNEGKPQLMNLKDVIQAFIDFREVVILRKTNFLLSKARNRAHLLLGLFIAVANIDRVIELIRSSKDPLEAKERLLQEKWHVDDISALIDLIHDDSNQVVNNKCSLTEEQAKAILDMRLHRLTGLEQEKISNEINELSIEIKAHLEILNSRIRLLEVLKEELVQIKEQFGTPRKTEIELNELDQDIEDLIPKEDMVVIVTHGGYIKRVPLSSYRAQRRGGKGKSGITVRDEDETIELFVANTHREVLFFSTIGKVYKIKVYKLPLATNQSKGRALVNIFPLAENETINQVMLMPEDKNEWENCSIMFATSKGNVRRNALSDFQIVQSNGKIAMKLDEDDSLIGVKVCTENDHIFMAAKNGRSVRFPVDAVRVFKSRTSDGVRGMRLTEDDRVVSLSVIDGREFDITERENYLRIPLATRVDFKEEENMEKIQKKLTALQVDLAPELAQKMAREEQFVLTITERGYGKRTSLYEYRVTNRGGSGVVNIVTSKRNGQVVMSMPISDDDQIMLITDKGTVIRTPVKDVRVSGRSTQGVTLFRTATEEKVVSAARIKIEDEDLEEESIELECKEPIETISPAENNEAGEAEINLLNWKGEDKGE